MTENAGTPAGTAYGRTDRNPGGTPDSAGGGPTAATAGGTPDGAAGRSADRGTDGISVETLRRRAADALTAARERTALLTSSVDEPDLTAQHSP